MALPDLNGLELQHRIATERADMPIIFITGYVDVPTTVRAMKAGAVEFLTKPFGDEALLEAIRGALARSASELNVATELQVLQDRYATLSSREREVMALVSSGLMNKQAGARLGISEITVKAHRGRVMRKMRAESLADLVNIAAKLGIPGPATVGHPELHGPVDSTSRGSWCLEAARPDLSDSKEELRTQDDRTGVDASGS
jgi:FixJ family two-component response regulator